ncbi:MFS transporter [Streptomyces clavuligerus]|uniref:Transmembrane efflux protein n=1 Tax=Streptomyces clavuligerus TaxID=1901 RepID=B5GUQ6_STRCL|nr:MFS transporter [Streptomyces clavuligerus]ANW17617.1 MFS transporter [Streptomyces clavuligerus]AXU12169.1 MFS transporter [Streptomyces clavuligerus]EDY50052.1 transmembrane efflux protein [Streptomyces clavuligerus]EFG09865.1 Transmembrane efflux protein [Streptomyces clavuligerus]MBY6302035.1 MFS transporter [Streptomyces clavuligerus]
MPSSYRAIFTAPGTKRFSAAGLFGRMPLAMMGIGIVTMVSQITGRYGIAGALSATAALSMAVLGPQISRLVDRYGQARVLRPAALASTAAVAGLLVCAVQEAPTWTLFVFTAVTGCVPSVGAMIRARWTEIYRDRPRELHTAYSWESLIDELCFVCGPIVAIALSTSVFPAAGPLAAAVLLLIGVFWLSAQRDTEPPVHPREGDRKSDSAIRLPGLQVLVVTFVAVGAAFGAVDVVSVAFAEEQGNKAAAGIVLGLYALGSAVAAVVFGMLDLKGPAPRRWLIGVTAMAVSIIPLQLAGDLVFLAVALFVAGMAIAPTMVTTMALVGHHVPRSSLTEGMTWVSTGLAIGVALGFSAGGWAVDEAGAEAGFLVPAIAGAAAVLSALLGYRRLKRPVPTAEGQQVDDHGQRERHSDTSMA